MTSQAETLVRRRGILSAKPSADRKSVTITLFAPRDGAGRQTSASDLTAVVSAQEFDRIAKDFVFLNAGLDRSK